MDKKAVIFDMDGTLLNTLGDLASSLNYALKECGYPLRSNSEVRSFIGEGIAKLIELAMPDYSKPPIASKESFDKELKNVYDKFVEYYIVHGEDDTHPYDGIIDLLTELKKKGIKTAVVSNKIKEAVEILNESKFLGLIDTAEGDGEGVRLKPAPDMLLKALKDLGIDKKDAVYVGDGETDICCAKGAGVDLISVSYGYRDEDFLIERGATTIAHSTQELARLLLD